MLRLGSVLLALTCFMAVVSPAVAQPRNPRYDFYDSGYREGYRNGERDARRGDRFDFEGARVFRRGHPEFRRGYAAGYRAAYNDFRRLVRQTRPGAFGSQRGARGGYQDPAFARGYADGYERGLDDGRDRDRYDPVRHGDYRDGDEGYDRGYGSRDAYKNNYRDGFRQGYEQGYRDGNRSGGRGRIRPF
jgi:flagellar biosynthesis/type III secretory pathway protein FliH